MENEVRIAVFKGKKIRKTIYQNEWWFSVIDVIEALTDSSIPKRYWSDLKAKLIEEGFSEAYEKIVRLKSDAKAGGDIAGGARKKLEKRLGRSIVSKNNFKALHQRKGDLAYKKEKAL